MVADRAGGSGFSVRCCHWSAGGDVPAASVRRRIGRFLPRHASRRGFAGGQYIRRLERHIYVPPQRGVFTVPESIRNSGPVPITTEGATASRPEQPGITARWPLTPAGQALYVPADGPGPTRGTPVAGLSLRPGQAIFVGIPVRLSDVCYVPNGWTGLNVFYVKERFLI